MAVSRAWATVAVAMMLAAVSAAVEVQNVTALDAMLPTTSVGHFDPAKYALPLPSNATNASGKGVEGAKIEAAAPSPSVGLGLNSSATNATVESVPGFVKTQGQQFSLNGRAAYFAGTNAWYLPIRAMFTDSQIYQFFSVMSQNSVNMVRVFCFEDGYSLSNTPIQSSPGNWDEIGLKRIDLILSQAAAYGIYVIIVPTNFEPVGGGIQWYVNEIVGNGYDKEMFYTDSRVKQAYKNYVYMLLTRTNSYTGVQYKNDPTIFSVELMNEPHTTDLYERNRGWPPGQLVRNWIWEMAAYVKSVDGNHMVSTGEEGYRADGPANPPHNNWINGGYKGVDFVGNIACPNIDFATLHVYPDNWAIQSWEFDWVNANVIRDRAAIAHAQNKPFIIEETGMKRGYLGSRDTLLDSLLGEANRNNVGATMVWEWIAWYIDDSSYSFDTNNDGSNGVWTQIKYMRSKMGSALTPSAPIPASGCTNIPPSYAYSCAQQVSWHPGCSVPWLQYPYCNQECGRCSAGSSGCTDNPPDHTFSCAEQAGWGQCGQSWMQGHCDASCGRCSPSCIDIAPPGSSYSCTEQSWMSGYCQHSCGNC
ncbi:g1238 [Coccomyxa viridis]|uniref:mannan endo-1,4-beta-mannosidase n=1 Tax=Coccomyxa viridis TaxID=1274662 RepID=A0ABP1FHJ5_9CHLO